MKTKCLKCEVVFEMNSCIPIEAQSLCPSCYAIDNIFRACALFVMIEKTKKFYIIGFGETNLTKLRKENQMRIIFDWFFTCVLIVMLCLIFHELRTMNQAIALASAEEILQMRFQ